MKKLVKIVLATCLLLPLSEQFTKAVAAESQVLSENKVTLILNTRQLYQNGAVFLAGAPHTVTNGVTFISIRALADRLGYKVSYNSSKREYTFANDVNSLTLAANRKQYTHNGKGFSFTDRTQPYTTQGTMMVPIREITTRLGIKVVPKLAENKVELLWDAAAQIPKLEAGFTTSKDTYKIGEPIEYTDVTTAAGSPIKSSSWSNNEQAFFTSGPQTVTLRVENQLGMVSTATKQIYISEEVMHTEWQFQALFTPQGEKLPIVREAVLDYKVIPFQLQHQPFTLVRSNSPERIVQEGIYYQDELSGHVRFLVHHQNARQESVKVYLVARNNGTTPAKVTINNVGLHGPNRFVSATGKNSVANYLTSLQKGSIAQTLIIEPDRAEIVVKELSSNAIPIESVLTMYADIHADRNLTFQVIVLDESNDLYQTYSYLHGISATRDGRHTRGTFDNGNRELTVSERIGTELSRIIIGDGETDPYVIGIDRFSGYDETNYGNRGVVYTVNLEKMAANTVLVVNPRGGHYAGAFLVNGKLVMAPTNGVISNPNEAVVLYRTGEADEKVTIQFIPASGSNLPINFLTIPLKEQN